MWYVIQTMTGQEQETVDVIDRVLEKNSYKSSFVIRQECVWRIEGRCQIHIETMFPSYVFVETDRPEEFFFALKRVPRLTKLLGEDNQFCTIEKEEELLLKTMIDGEPDYIVRCSLVIVDSDREICSAEGILKEFLSRIVKKRLRKRYVVVEIPFCGRKKQVRLGIQLIGDKKEE